MPIAASSSADTAKVVSRIMLKSERAVDRTDDLVHRPRRAPPAGRRSPMRSSRWMAALIAYGSPRVRTIQASGVMSSRFALWASGICAHGTYMIGCGSRLSPPSRTSPAMPTIWRPASSMLRAEPLADRDAVGQRIAGRPEPLRHRLVDDRHAGRAAGVLIGERAAPHDRNLEGAEVGRRDRREPAAAVRRSVERPPFDDDRQAEPALRAARSTRRPRPRRRAARSAARRRRASAARPPRSSRTARPSATCASSAPGARRSRD